MRRRRPQLQISLFPFLSVLLCTLGSLILLLLVLDQKARQAKADEVQAQERAAHETQNAERDRLEAELHQRLESLRARRGRLRSALKTQFVDQTTEEESLRRKRADLVALQQLLDAELAKGDALARAVGVALRQSRAQTEQRTAADAELARLLQQIQSMETIVQRLQEATQNRRPLYSLIPYRGKHGTNRQALYAECVHGELIFHPGDARLSLADAYTPGRLQAELAERVARLPMQVGAQKPYMLLLIRPSGLSLYYAVVRALSKSDIEIGYEFIDESWTIDFSAAGSEAVAAQQPSVGGQGPGVGSQASGNASQGTGPSGSGGQRPGSVGRGTAGPLTGAGGQGTGGAGLNVGRPGLPAPASGTSPGGVTLLPPPGKPSGTGPSDVKPSELSGNPATGAGGATKSDGDAKSGDAAQGEERTTPPKPVRAGGTNGEEGGQAAGNRPRPLGGPQNNEWQIVILCKADSVALEYPPMRFELGQLAGSGNALVSKLREVIEQKKQRNPDARPQLKFVIHRDALRAYYAAAGALESLHLPTKWEIEKD